MTRTRRSKNIPKRTRAKMLALCHIAGVKAEQRSYGYDDHRWYLSVTAKPAVVLPHSAGYQKWRVAVKFLLGV